MNRDIMIEKKKESRHITHIFLCKIHLHYRSFGINHFSRTFSVLNLHTSMVVQDSVKHCTQAKFFPKQYDSDSNIVTVPLSWCQICDRCCMYVFQTMTMTNTQGVWWTLYELPCYSMCKLQYQSKIYFTFFSIFEKATD